MTKSWEKFINKNIYKNDLKSIIEDILKNNLSSYFVVKLKGYEDYYRIRKGKIRVVFIKKDDENEIVAVDTRGGIYKGL
ncbi:type II toxin-antitoxin system RelE/ParE family toxin [Candidatus Gracilibacteria bacterium]|nr:type II toxin-antitoxin system RelE/ParE family toxin [Candidatus Gracilibacteria bacterium]